MIVTSALLSLIVALLFHMTELVSVTPPLLIVSIAPLCIIVQVLSLMTAVLTHIAEVMSVTTGILWHATGILWLSEKLLSDPIAAIIEPDRDAKNPTIAAT